MALRGGPGAGPDGEADVATLRVTVACGPEPASGEVTLDIAPGLVLDPDAESAPMRYELAGGGYASWELPVRALPDAPPGRYFVAARIGDDLGQVLEDAAMISVGMPPEPQLDLPLEELLPLLEADIAASVGEVELDLRPATLALAAGEQGELTVRLVNRTAAPIRGECQLISPVGSWPAVGPWTRGFSAAPGEAIDLAYPVALPPHARPGAQWWALAKVMYFGRLCYSKCARLEVRG
jgi:hypothetical protein